MAIYDISGNELNSTALIAEPMGDDIPVVTLSGTLPVAKGTEYTNVVLRYTSLTDSFISYAQIRVQGDSSTIYPKKNFTIKLFSDSGRTKKLKKQFRDWDKARNKFVLKANWIDHSHSRNVVTARLWTEIVKSRSDYDYLPSALRNGNTAIDGFPVKVYNNGVYLGLYTWNLPKDAMYGLDEDVATNAIVMSGSTQSNYDPALLWRSSTMDGKWDDETHDTMPSAIESGFNTLLNFVYTASDADFVSNFITHFDKQSIIDQYILLYVGCIADNIGKNQTFFTYDATIWYGGMYDLDGTWGLPPFGVTSWLSPTTAFQSQYQTRDTEEKTNLLYKRVSDNFTTDIKNRYGSLRSGVLSEDSICGMFEEFVSAIPPYIYSEDYASTTGGGAYTDIPLKDTNNIQQIRQFVVDRLAYVDSQILGS